MKRDTTTQLDAFRRHQEEADRQLRTGDDGKEVEEAGSPTAGESGWAVDGKKRKRVKQKESLKGVKLRRVSLSGYDSVKPQEVSLPGKSNTSKTPIKVNSTPTAEAKETAKSKLIDVSKPLEASGPGSVTATTSAKGSSSGLGLAGYSSDEED